ncbi:hypothetical protein I5677_14140 [Mobilitalea sibirica]|uniref:DUF6449 domain-containing protein n=1 Tax=Mobilitalea sibirica TaxID=1462919 RepID=A0A8J7L384_9FIRM|nr:DUF6449 domain-containing protein [Mobilitalea sibirica]MBH1942038.1 hypothetical protein [Mobilitalea sibirica]
MTSKSLFFKLQREDIKRRIWTIALSMLGFFILLPLNLAMRLGQDSLLDWEWIQRQLLSVLGVKFELMFLFTIAGAVVCGLSGYFYLHSRKKVDLYHSVPVRRETLFAFSYLNGLLIYLVPYIINIILSFVVLQFNDRMNTKLFTTAMSTFGFNVLFYLLIYTTVIIAVMLTGNFVISCFGTAVLFFYGPVLMAVKEMFFSGFFSTYYQNNNVDSMILRFLSPVGVYFDTANNLNQGREQGLAIRLSIVFIVTILLIGLSVYLYKKRPSEAATHAMAFAISKPIIKFLLVIPVSLGGGIVFQQITDRGSIGWFVFGMIFTLLLSYAIIEIIYNFDIRSAFRHKGQLLACAGIVAVIAVIFHFDLFGYDNYIPKKDKIESMSVAFSGLDDNIRYFDFETDNTWYMNPTTYQLKNMKLTDMEDAYALAKVAIDKNIETFYPGDAFNYTVKYTLTSGRKVYRSYRLYQEDGIRLLKKIYDNEQYKEGHFPIYQWKSEDIRAVSCYNMLNDIAFSLNPSKINQLLEIYKEELRNLSIEDMNVRYPIATLVFKLGHESMYYNVYPTFVKTIAFLADHGFDVNDNVDVDNIKEIVITNYVTNKMVMDKYGDKIYRTSAYEDLSKSYTDKKEIEKIYPLLINRDYYWDNQTIINAEDMVEVTVIVAVDEYGNVNQHSFYFEKGKIPDFVKQDIKYVAE